MAGDTNIEWATKVWNPLAGCSVVSPGCTNCYAMKMAARIESMAAGRGQTSSYDGLTRKTKAGAVWTGEMRLIESALTQPLRWRKPALIFVNSMSDLFHEDVPDAWIDQVFAGMALSPQHTYQILTKRVERMRRYLTDPDRIVRMLDVEVDHPTGRRQLSDLIDFVVWAKPLPNVWLGVSAEDQARADERIPDLLATPAAVRFVSAEPLLGPIDLTALELPGGDSVLDSLNRASPADHWASEWSPEATGVPLDEAIEGFEDWGFSHPPSEVKGPGLDWVIVGGESGPGARPMHPDWARQIRDDCAAAGVAFFFKQWGTYAWAESVEGDPSTLTHYRAGKKAGGRLLDGMEHNAMPEIC